MRPVAATLELRRATPLDAFAMAAVHRASWPAAYASIMPPPMLRALATDSRPEHWLTRLGAGTRAWVAEASGHVVGFISGGRSRDRDGSGEIGEIYSLYVHPDAWGTGTGARLMAHATTQLGRRGCLATTLWVLEGNARARRFYDRIGFVEDGATDWETYGEVALKLVRYRRQHAAA